MLDVGKYYGRFGVSFFVGRLIYVFKGRLSECWNGSSAVEVSSSYFILQYPG